MKHLCFFFKSMRKRLTVKIVIIVMLSIFPLNILAVQFMINMGHEMEKQIYLSTKNVADMYMSNLQTQMAAMDAYLFELITEDTDALQLLDAAGDAKAKHRFQNAKIWTTRKLLNNCRTDQGMNGYFIYVKEQNEFIFASLYGNGKVQRDELKENLRIAVSDAEIARKWQLYVVDNHQYALHMSHMNQVTYGAFIDLEFILDQIKKDINYEDFTAEFTKQERFKEAKDEVVVSVQNEKLAGCMNIVVENINMMTNGSIWRKIQIIMVIVCLFCAPFLYAELKKMFLIPLSKLNEAHYQLEIGNRDYRILEEASSLEMSTAFDSFNRMADHIQDLRLENMKKELEKKQLELSNLQLQIRPHFLLNTFNLIYNLSLHNENEGVRNIILYLSDYFRYIFKSDKDKELFGKELKLIEGYMEMVKLRYPGRTDILYQIDPDVLMVRIPPLLVHNFVENVIKHGMEDDAPICIILSAEYEQGKVLIEVRDDGKGMEKELVDAINSGALIQNEDNSHVGLKNSIKRLKYFYGEQAQIYVSSKEEEGTSVTLTFPYDLNI